METVGFIGIGRMGSAISGNLQKAGYPMVVLDVREEATKPLVEKGARLAGSPAEVARLSDVIFTSLPTPSEVDEVAIGPDGILEGIKEGSVYLDLSTCGPNLVRRLEPMFRQKGAYMLDAPVLSSPQKAIERKLIVMVGGEREVFERIRSILPAFSDQVLYAGALGSGCICKVATNMGWLSTMQVMAEGLTLGVKAGVELEALVEAGSRTETGGLLGNLREYLSQTVFSGQFDPQVFTLALARKDIGLATELGRQYNVPLPAADLAEENMMQGINRGWAGDEWIKAFLVQEDRAGVSLRMPGKG